MVYYFQSGLADLWFTEVDDRVEHIIPRKPPQSAYEQLTFDEFSGAMAVYGIVTSVVVISFILEYIWSKFNQKSKIENLD